MGEKATLTMTPFIGGFLDEIIKSGMSMEVSAARAFLSHALDARHLTRFKSERPEAVLLPILEKFRDAKPLLAHAGKPFVYNAGEGRKVMGEIDARGWITPKTYYGPGNPHDKRRPDIDITSLLIRKDGPERAQQKVTT